MPFAKSFKKTRLADIALNVFGVAANVYIIIGLEDITTCLEFQTVSDLFQTWADHSLPYKCRISRYSCFPIISNGSDLFQTFLGRPLISI